MIVSSGGKRRHESRLMLRCHFSSFLRKKVLVFLVISLAVLHLTTRAKLDNTSSSPSMDVLLNAAKARVVDDELGAVVFLAPQRHEGSLWNIDRFCMLLRAVRSVDRYLNTKYGPYPIYILVAKDHELDPRHKDGIYKPNDRALIRSWAPHSKIHFVEIYLYSQEALEPGTTRDQIMNWRINGTDGAVTGRDLGYTSMSRLWSGRLQGMSFLDRHQYYMRMDDDSLLLETFPYDPFEKMQRNNLTYTFRREAFDHWGIEHLWRVSKEHLDFTTRTDAVLPFLRVGEEDYSGRQPYNNFHVSSIDFWRSEKWTRLWDEMNEEHLFFKYRVGDANVHAIAIMMMEENAWEKWPEVPYAHNSNDYHQGWGSKDWVAECKAAYQKWLH